MSDSTETQPRRERARRDSPPPGSSNHDILRSLEAQVSDLKKDVTRAMNSDDEPRRERLRRDSSPPGSSNHDILRSLEAQVSDLKKDVASLTVSAEKHSKIEARRAEADAKRDGANALMVRITAAFGGLLTAVIIGTFVWAWNTNVTAKVQADRMHRITEQYGETSARAQITRSSLETHSRELALGARQDEEIIRRLDSMESAANQRNTEIMSALERVRRNTR